MLASQWEIWIARDVPAAQALLCELPAAVVHRQSVAETHTLQQPVRVGEQMWDDLAAARAPGLVCGELRMSFLVPQWPAIPEEHAVSLVFAGHWPL